MHMHIMKRCICTSVCILVHQNEKEKKKNSAGTIGIFSSNYESLPEECFQIEWTDLPSCTKHVFVFNVWPVFVKKEKKETQVTRN